MTETSIINQTSSRNLFYLFCFFINNFYLLWWNETPICRFSFCLRVKSSNPVSRSGLNADFWILNVKITEFKYWKEFCVINSHVLYLRIRWPVGLQSKAECMSERSCKRPFQLWVKLRLSSLALSLLESFFDDGEYTLLYLEKCVFERFFFWSCRRFL
jgi:hypothetical protein